jgi:diguanylate cyclase (GGDEF)-like protein
MTPRVRRLARILGAAAVYFVAGRLALTLAIPPGYATAVWPAAGLALAGILLLGSSIWPGIFVGSFLVNIGTGFDTSTFGSFLGSLLVPACIAAGASLQAVIGARLVRRFTSDPASLAPERDLLKLLALGGPASSVTNATLAVTTLVLMGRIGAREIPFSWWTWWIGDTIGVLIFTPLVLMWAPRATRMALSRRVWVTVPLCCTFVAAVTLFVRASRWEQRRTDLEFTRRTDELAHAVGLNLDAHLKVLEFLGGLFCGATPAERADLHVVAQRFLERNPGIEALGWCPYVSRADRERLEKRERVAKEGQPADEFEIRDRDGGDGLVRAPEREAYIPVLQLESVEACRLPLGLDLAAVAACSEALARARDSGEVAATAPLGWLRAAAGGSSVLFFQPVYSGRNVPTDPVTRRQCLAGFAVGMLELVGFLGDALPGEKRDDIDVELWDVTDAGAPHVLDRGLEPGSRAGARPDGEALDSATARIAPIPIGGRSWDLRFDPSPEFRVERSWQVWSFLAGGLLFTGVLGAFLLVVTGRTVRIEEVVAQRTLELRRTNDALRREVVRRVKAQKIANIDPLTELLNRRGLEAELSTEVRRARRTGSTLAAVLLDCDDFKRINETLGHAVGDIVLKEIANRLKEALRPTDHLARIGGDEFLALLPETRRAESVLVAERLRLSVSDSPIRLPSGPLTCTASLGIELVPTDVLSIEEVLARTHLSLQHSKRTGKNRVSSHGARGTPRGLSLQPVVDALKRGQSFRSVKQAIRSLSDESVVGFEFLSRGPRGGFEMPGTFFRLALECNILTLVDLHCLRACVAAARQLPPEMRCHVNLLPSTLIDMPEERLVELFPPAGGGPRFCVEVGEQQFIGDPSCLRGPVRVLKEAGIHVAIDDVGFGRSSLETLILLEPDVVKIDQKVVKGAARDTGKERSLRRLVGVASALGSELVAEGIESREDLELLREIGVASGQGFLWDRPG